ncbi:hypothetical protein ACFLXN_00835 [Chloroflexota bacterium]
MIRSTIELSKDELAGLLYCWTFRCVDESEIRRFSEEFSCDINEYESYYSVRQLLLILNMWLVVTGCQSQLQGWGNLYNCLEMFHHMVYAKGVKGDECDYVWWLKSITGGYDDYDKAVTDNRAPARILGITRVIVRSIWGDVKNNQLAVFKIGSYINDHYQHLIDFLSRCDLR